MQYKDYYFDSKTGLFTRHTDDPNINLTETLTPDDFCRLMNETEEEAKWYANRLCQLEDEVGDLHQELDLLNKCIAKAVQALQ